MVIVEINLELIQNVCEVGALRVLITGGAGFIGSTLVDALLDGGHEVRIVDNFSTGRWEFLRHLAEDKVDLRTGDLIDSEFARTSIEGVDVVVHLAANADVRFGWEHPARDIEQNILVTHNVLEALRAVNCKRILFSSTGSVYGKSPQVPTPENASFPIQTSLYGASKVAGEALIAAYSEAGIVDATVFRFVSILGPRYTHGHVLDFVAQLVKDPTKMRVLGDGSQSKSYLHVSDCVRALTQFVGIRESFGVYNLGVDTFCTVKDSISWITDELRVSPSIEFGKQTQGWVGDNPLIYLDTRKIRDHGWSPSYSIEDSVRDTVRWLMKNRWALELAVV